MMIQARNACVFCPGEAAGLKHFKIDLFSCLLVDQPAGSLFWNLSSKQSRSLLELSKMLPVEIFWNDLKSD